MSLRKRSLLSLLVVIVLTALSIVAIVVKPTILGLDLQGGTEVILQAEETADGGVTPDALRRAVNIINRRVNAFGVSEPEVQIQGDDKIRVALPGIEDQSQVDDLVKAAQLKVYPYEPLLVDREPFPAPASTLNPTTDLYSLIDLALEQPKGDVPDDAAGPYVYLFRKNAAHTLISGPKATRNAILTELRTAPDKAALFKEVTDNPGRFEYRSVPKGYVILTLAGDDENYDEATPCGEGGTCALLRDDPGLTGTDVKSASLGFDQINEPEVQLEFSGQGRTRFAALTREIVEGARAEGRPASGSDQFWRFAMAIDGVVISTPFVDYNQNPDGIDSSIASIGGGGFTEETATRLADQISSGSLPIKLNKVSTATVGAVYGEESLKAGLTAGLIGLIVVIIGLMAYYRLLGVIAGLIIIIYGLMLWAVSKVIPIALTLPGIAGTLLTIGVAADASVVIFERIREEMRQGREAKAAVLSGYRRGLTAILDANAVTFVSALFIFLLSTSGPRGFAFTLMIGVILAMVTAVIATPAILGLLVESRIFKNESLVGLKSREPRWKMDVVGKWRFWLGISFLPLVAGLVFVFTNGINQGIDFTGGSKQTITFAQSAPGENAVRDVVTAAGYGDAKVVTVNQTIAGQRVEGFSIESRTLNSEPKARALLEDLNSEFRGSNGQVTQLEFTAVGPTFGADVVRNAIWAILFSFILIVGYLTLRFELKLALPALVSVVHDVWLTLTIYSIAGLEVTAATVAAFLTVLGYSLYDVVIVFDRIRENEPLMRGRRYRDIVNRSIHETLTRTIITLISTLLPVLVLLLFGGDTLKDFSFALFIGIMAGGISSIFISAPIAALWKEHEPDQQKLQAKLAKKQARLAAVDSDILDVEALSRAEASMAGEPVRAQQTDMFGQPQVGLPEPPDDGPDDTPPAPSGGQAPTAGNGDGPPQRNRRHQSVQRKRRR